jgi:hypothetical protein
MSFVLTAAEMMSEMRGTLIRGRRDGAGWAVTSDVVSQLTPPTVQPG